MMVLVRYAKAGLKMEGIIIEGGKALNGAVRIQGSKNAALPILAATLLIHGKTILSNCPHITDTEHMLNLLRSAGCTVSCEKDRLVVDAASLSGTGFPRKDADCMRSSVILLGAMLGRCKEVSLSYPGGCVIGERPIDLHLQALAKLGVRFRNEDRMVHASCTCLHGNDVNLPIRSVGVTENLILAAVLAKGNTRIYPAAREPEVVALCDFLKKAGARILGAGSDEIIIMGVKQLEETEYRVEADRIVAGTYLFAAAGCGGTVELAEAPVMQMQSVLRVLRQMGAVVQADGDGQHIRLEAEGRPHRIPFIQTAVYPGFPTDLQSNLMTALLKADGSSVVEERIFENRFRILPELRAMGADLTRTDERVIIRGVERLTGTELTAMELRGGAGLVCAGMMAEGKSTVRGVEYIRRGYENIVEDLKQLGAGVRWAGVEEL